MAKPWTYGEHTYTFDRSRGTVKPIRDDGCTMFSTYETTGPMSLSDIGWWKPAKRKYYHAHLPAFATVKEAQAAIMNQPQPTFVHMPVWARTAEEAAQIREAMENERTETTAEPV